MPSDTSLTAFIASNPDARELKRALAVHMTQLGFKQTGDSIHSRRTVELH